QTLAKPVVWNYGYTTAGNLDSVLRFDNGSTRYQYDSTDRLVGLTNTDQGGRVLSGYEYTLDTEGRRTSALETQLEADGSTSQTRLTGTNDSLGRVTSEASPDLTGGRTAFDYRTDYFYDLDGNLVEERTTRAGVVSAVRYTYDDNNRLVRQVDSSGAVAENFYNANGNLVEVHVNDAIAA